MFLRWCFFLNIFFLLCKNFYCEHWSTLFSAYDIHKIENSISDYGKIDVSPDYFYEVTPPDIKTLQKIVLIAYQHNIPLRIRGSGHSFNGISVPKPEELLVRMSGIDHYVFEEENTMTVGAGAVLWNVRDLAAQYKLKLPVYNEFTSGPTVGGFVCGGGIGGLASGKYGGFWEHVKTITIVSGKGELISFDRDNPEFAWFYGSMGQIGIIVEVKLKLLQQGGSPYPMGVSGKVPLFYPLDIQKNNAVFETKMNTGRWISLSIPLSLEREATKFLFSMYNIYPDLIINKQFYRYLIKKFEFTPPLIYPKNEDFVIIGMVGRTEIETDGDNRRLLIFERNFTSWSVMMGLKLYFQTQPHNRNMDYKQYFGTEVYEKFYLLKKKYDPKLILNRGSFFKNDE